MLTVPLKISRVVMKEWLNWPNCVFSKVSNIVFSNKRWKDWLLRRVSVTTRWSPFKRKALWFVKSQRVYLWPLNFYTRIEAAATVSAELTKYCYDYRVRLCHNFPSLFKFLLLFLLPIPSSFLVLDFLSKVLHGCPPWNSHLQLVQNSNWQWKLVHCPFCLFMRCLAGAWQPCLAHFVRDSSLNNCWLICGFRKWKRRIIGWPWPVEKNKKKQNGIKIKTYRLYTFTKNWYAFLQSDTWAEFWGFICEWLHWLVQNLCKNDQKKKNKQKQNQNQNQNKTKQKKILFFFEDLNDLNV